MIEINPERHLNDLNNLRSFGSVGNGVVRTAFSDIMIFVPGIAGISHDFNEDTAEKDIIPGCQVMAAVVDFILQDEARKC